MDADLTPHDIDRTGIGPEAARVARGARDAGRRLRLIASAARGSDGRVSGSVRPEELEGDDLLAQVRGKANALILHTDLLGDVAIHQLGGDLTMTAYALLSDLITVRRRAGD
jgi:homoserine dehydrogenase